MIEKLFVFPIAMIDGDNEDKKIRKAEDMALDTENEVDVIIGEAECPYYDFLSVSDRWLPTPESFQAALQGKFDACFVSFSQSGNYVVPWSKTKFKKELKKFIDKQPKDEEVIIDLQTLIEKVREVSNLYHISYVKERFDTMKLVEIIEKDSWIDSNTILVTCSPDYSSNVSQILNHKLSYLNRNELYENIPLEMPYPIMSQVWDRETSEVIGWDRYLLQWVNKYINPTFKYLFIDSATLRGKNFSRVNSVVKTKADVKFASLYLQDDSIFIPDYYVEKFSKEKKGGLIFEWENSDNPNWNY